MIVVVTPKDWPSYVTECALCGIRVRANIKASTKVFLSLSGSGTMRTMTKRLFGRELSRIWKMYFFWMIIVKLRMVYIEWYTGPLVTSSN